ncbi:ankyrin repeat family protein [Anaeramoeba flamelloides]|uniref:Ankyrin repeat family protein n=1 Tax=Anaeramoeba flamelloides TaxID=1746091 RepID=A0AAV7YUB6_9EUKA|nr:ankyrin repeat family protein [Anaeramoeba flamelloides]
MIKTRIPRQDSFVNALNSHNIMRITKKIDEYCINLNENIDGQTPLYIVTSYGDCNLVKEFLGRGSNPDLKTEWEYFPLYIASKQGYYPIVRLLLKNNSDPKQTTKKGHQSLYVACKKGHYSIVSLLLKYETIRSINDKNCFESFQIAISNGYLSIALLFLQKGLNPNQKDTGTGYNSLHIACKKGDLSTVQTLLQYGAYLDSKTNKEGKTPFIIAAENGHLSILQELVDSYTNKNESNKNRTKTRKSQNLIDFVNQKTVYNETALFFASKEGHYEVCEYLISKGALVNMKTKNGNFPLYEATKNGNTEIVQLLIQSNCFLDMVFVDWPSLFIAIQNGYFEITKLLIESGCDLNYVDITDGFNALMVAIESNEPSIAEYLINKGINFKTFTNNSKETPLHLAAASGEREICKLLLSYGLDINFEDETGMTPIMYAIENENENVIKFLLKNGAKYKLNNQFYPIEEIENSLILELLSSYHQISRDFLYLFQFQECCDLFIADKFSNKIGLHKIFVETRLNRKLDNNLITFFKQYSKAELNHFFMWLYSGIVPKKNSPELQIIKQIAGNLKLNFDQKSGKKSLVQDLKKCLNNKSTSDFQLQFDNNIDNNKNSDNNNNQTIFLHKFVLLARSNLFKGLFNSIGDLNHLRNNTPFSFHLLKPFLQYLYTDELEIKLDSQLYDQFKEAIEYFQLSKCTSLNYWLNKLY